jgi:putative nucleotidyltransferase with HDIG domain
MLWKSVHPFVEIGILFHMSRKMYELVPRFANSENAPDLCRKCDLASLSTSSDIIRDMTDFLQHILPDRLLTMLRAKDDPGAKILMGILVLLLASLLFPTSQSIENTLNVGAVWTEQDLIASFSFPILKDERQYDAELQASERIVYPIYKRQSGEIDLLAGRIGQILQNLQHVADQHPGSDAARTNPDTAAIARIFGSLSRQEGSAVLSYLSTWKRNDSKSLSQPAMRLQSLLTGISFEIIRKGIVDTSFETRTLRAIAVRTGTVEEIVSAESVYDRRSALRAVHDRLTARSADPAAQLVLRSFLPDILRPNLVYSELETHHAIRAARDNVPRSIGFVRENERIVGKYERISPEIRQKLDSYRKAKAEFAADGNSIVQRIGIFFHVGIILGLYVLYLALYRKRIYHSNAMLLLISVLVMLVAFVAFLTRVVSVGLPLQYLIMVPAISMLLTIVFDSRVAFYGTVVLAFLIAGIRGNDYSIALASLVAGSLGVYTVRDVRNRTQIFRSIGFIFLGYALSIAALALERFESLDTVGFELSVALANSIVSPLLTYGLLIFIERTFKVTTDLTLVELSDLSRPLLQQLSERAPGTFHHSMMLGNLVEAAAEAIGANDVLAKVGAYYHDIGKTLKPEFFIENQVGNNNRHRRMRPHMSARVIISHVTEGVDLARKHHLPEAVVDFIPQHHGTTRVSYFYDKALKLGAAKENPKQPLRVADFQYPGPKPQSKETGILMLADLIEASVRTLPDMSEEKLDAVIDNLIKRRFLEGQLDECDLTLKDLKKIKEAFLKILVGVHHQRIEYPEPEQPVQVAAIPPVDEAFTTESAESLPPVVDEPPPFSADDGPEEVIER